MFCPALSIGAALIIIRTAPHRELPVRARAPRSPNRRSTPSRIAAPRQERRALPIGAGTPTHTVPSALLRRKMLLLRKSICTGAIHLPLCFLMSYGFLARSRASIRSAAENCYRRNSLPPLNNLNQAETRSAASRPKKVHDFRRRLFLEQGTGVEPALTAWEAAVIPIYQPCDGWSISYSSCHFKAKYSCCR